MEDQIDCQSMAKKRNESSTAQMDGIRPFDSLIGNKVCTNFMRNHQIQCIEMSHQNLKLKKNKPKAKIKKLEKLVN